MGLQTSDQLVIFGITGDLAKKMTFPSLYNLEKRGLLTTPILGVAFDDWEFQDIEGVIAAPHLEYFYLSYQLQLQPYIPNWSGIIT